MAESPEADDFSARVIRVIADTQRLPRQSIAIDSTFEELKIDSLDGINIVFALENEFGIEIPDEGVRSMVSVRQVTQSLQELVNAKQQMVPPGAA